MKTKPIIIAALLAATNAYPVTVNWIEDSYTGFCVALTGTGINTFDTGPIELTSPSGLWDFNMRQWFKHFDNANPNHILMGQGGTLVFNETPPPDTFIAYLPDRGLLLDSYEEFVPIGSLLTTMEGWHGSFTWGGINLISITSVPDLNDPSCWTWVSFYEAHGPSLARVPDAGSTLSLLVLGLTTTVLAYRRLKS